MSRCGTVFNDEEDDERLLERISKLRRLALNNPNFHEGVSANEKANELEAKLKRRWKEQEQSRDENIFKAVEAIAKRHYAIADTLMDGLNKCRSRQSTRGIDEMVAYAFNSQGIDPNYGGPGGLPVGKHPVTITKTEAKPTRDNQGGYIQFTLTAFDGPNKGMSTFDNLNLHNKSQQAVEIANKQLAAYCAVTGVFHFQDTDELMNKPFVIEIAQQRDNPQYTEVVALFDMNGNEPGKAGSGPMTGQGQGGGFPQGNAGGQASGGFPQGQQGQQGQQGGQTNGGGWGGQPQNGAGQPDPNAQQGQNGGQAQGGGTAGWGQNTGQQGGQPQNNGGAAGWQQNGGGAAQGGATPGWGQR